jgi:hypothetical protein
MQVSIIFFASDVLFSPDDIKQAHLFKPIIVISIKDNTRKLKYCFMILLREYGKNEKSSHPSWPYWRWKDRCFNPPRKGIKHRDHQR